MKNSSPSHRRAGAAALVVLLTTNLSSPAQNPTPVPAATTAEFLAEPLPGVTMVAEYQGENYGFFIDNKGVIRALHDSSGKILLDSIGEWVLQRNSTQHAGWIRDPDCQASVTEEKEGDNKVYVVEIVHPKVIQRSRIVCRESGPDISAQFEIVDFSDGAGLNFPVRFNAANVEAGKPDFNDNPAVFMTKDGASVSIGYNDDKFSPFGNQQNGAYIAGDLGMTFYPKFDNSKEAGSKDTLTLDIQMP